MFPSTGFYNLWTQNEYIWVSESLDIQQVETTDIKQCSTAP